MKKWIHRPGISGVSNGDLPDDDTPGITNNRTLIEEIERILGREVTPSEWDSSVNLSCALIDISSDEKSKLVAQNFRMGIP